MLVSTTFTIDEQAHLWISVTDAKSRKATKFLIVQKYSTIGKGAKGVPAKSINYLVLVPRSIPLRLAIPKNLLVPGRRYFIRVIARDPEHHFKTLYIPFRA